MAVHGAEIRESMDVLPNQPIWQRYEPELKAERTGVAQSAKRSKTLSERYGLDAERSSHLGSAPRL